MMTHLIGYLALGFGLVAMGMKRMVILRIVHMLSALTYIIYGTMIDASPVIVGGSLFIVVHGYHLIRMRKAA